MRLAEVYVNGVYAGLLTEEAKGYRFAYDEEYVQGGNTLPVCLALPVRSEPYESYVLFPFFSNLLSEGSNRVFQTRYHHLRPEDDFGLLLATAGYDTIGNVTVRPR
ncbi:MAG: HipA N-terminal domain-containing protein [Bacteroidales bacterium]|nr:HipA N-terminal domain-containing protein [Bacteroidales bacterium]